MQYQTSDFNHFAVSCLTKCPLTIIHIKFPFIFPVRFLIDTHTHTSTHFHLPVAIMFFVFGFSGHDILNQKKRDQNRQHFFFFRFPLSSYFIHCYFVCTTTRQLLYINLSLNFFLLHFHGKYIFHFLFCRVCYHAIFAQIVFKKKKLNNMKKIRYEIKSASNLTTHTYIHTLRN